MTSDISGLDANQVRKIAYKYVQEELDRARAEVDEYDELSHDLAQVEAGLPGGLREAIDVASGGRDRLIQAVERARRAMVLVKVARYLADHDYDTEVLDEFVQSKAKAALADKGSKPGRRVTVL